MILSMVLDINNSTLIVVFLILILIVGSIGFALFKLRHYVGLIDSNTTWWKKLLYLLICLLIGIVLASAKYCITGKGLLESGW